jgi:tetratricopeptide (TPR) repeat protein
MMMSRGELLRSDQLLSEAELIAQRLGNRQRLRRLRAYRADNAFLRGEWDELLRFADEFIAECEAGAPHSNESDLRADRATIRLGRGDAEGALADCEKAVEQARFVGRWDSSPDVLASVAAIYLALGRPEEARTLVDETLSRYPDRPSPALAWSAEGVGRRREVEASLAQIPSISGWRRAGELILEGRFDSAADVFAEMGALEQEARARLRAAQQLAEQGRHKEGEAQLEKALAFYRSVGATRYIRQADALLAATRPVSGAIGG